MDHCMMASPIGGNSLPQIPQLWFKVMGLVANEGTSNLIRSLCHIAVLAKRKAMLYKMLKNYKKNMKKF